MIRLDIIICVFLISMFLSASVYSVVETRENADIKKAELLIINDCINNAVNDIMLKECKLLFNK